MIIRKRKPAKERKEEIVETAIKLTAECGPDRLTTEDLAKEIGITQPAIFRHFPSKSDMWDAVGNRIGALIIEATDSIESTGPTDRLRKTVASQLRFIATTPAIPAILFSRELHSGNEKLRRFFALNMKQHHMRFSNLIADGIKTGEFDESVNPDDAAYLILAIVQGCAMRWSLNNREFDLVTEGQKMLELQIHGLARR